MKVRIEKIVYPGRPLARLEGKTLFTDWGLPGELVEAEIVRTRKDYLEARTTAVLEPSPRRVGPRCGHYRACSPYQDLDYAAQLEIKESQFREMFLRFLGREPPALEVQPSPQVWNYRNKFHLRVLKTASGTEWAYHRPGSRDELVAITDCALLSPRLNELLSLLRSSLGPAGMGAVRELIARDSLHESQALLGLVVEGSRETELLRAPLLGLDFPLAGVVIFARDRSAGGGLLLRGRDFIREKIAGVVFSSGLLSFFQVNVPLLETLIAKIRSFVREEKVGRLADLYCGVGAFGIALSGDVAEVSGVEYSRESFSFLKKNLAENRIGNFTARRSKSEDALPGILAGGVDLLLLDPPRAGLAPAALEAIVQNPPPLLAYVSCNPSTLLRDLKALIPLYRPVEILLPDFFPHTPHIEACCLLKRSV